MAFLVALPAGRLPFHDAAGAGEHPTEQPREPVKPPGKKPGDEAAVPKPR